MERTRIPEPTINNDEMSNVFGNMYINSVSRRLRDLNAPSENDKKRWIWELIQNAKDTIANDPNRNSINIRIEVAGDEVKFRHDGAPFSSKTLLGLLYKYSEDKGNKESTGRFGTGFLTTHCLSKIVTIESNQYMDRECTKLCGFSVTMYRDGLTREDLLNGLKKMQDSKEFYSDTFEWTTFTYHVSSETGREAVKLGIQNFKEYIAQTMLFCKELSSVVLDDNGVITTITRKPTKQLSDDLSLSEFDISGEESIRRHFISTSFTVPDQELSRRYKSDREIRLDAAVEIDENNNVVSQDGKITHFCVLPLVGIEKQLNEPIIINCPDFEPDSERQSLLLIGNDWNEETDTISEVGINQSIYKHIFTLYERLVCYLSSNSYGCLYNLANGLLSIKDHEKTDREWYKANVRNLYRESLLKYNVVDAFEGTGLKTINDCIIAKEEKMASEDTVYELLKSIYPDKLAKDNHEWAKRLWKDDLNIWNTEELCRDIQNKGNWNQIETSGIGLSEWYNKFLEYVSEHDKRLLSDYTLLPNMNGDLMKIDDEEFKQGVNVTDYIIELLNKLGKDVKPMLLHDDVTAVALASKYTSQSYSADINHLVESIIDDDNNDDDAIVNSLLPLIETIPSDVEKFGEEFITKRKNLYSILVALDEIKDSTPTYDDNLLKNAWEELDKWLVEYILSRLDSIGSLTDLPEELDVEWLNNSINALSVNTDKLNEYAVLPNQDGDFCHQKDLFVDAGIPEVLKDDVFDEIDLRYKKILLHKDIEASNFSIIQKKTISDFASELDYEIEGKDSNSYGNYFYWHYHRHEQNTIMQVSNYMIGLLPKDKDSQLYHYQESLFTVYKAFNGEVKMIDYIDYDKRNIWNSVSFYICCNIWKQIEEHDSLFELCEDLQKNESEMMSLLNSYYAYQDNADISYTSDKVIPNQNGTLCKKEDLYKEEDAINNTLKEITKLLSAISGTENYYDILVDNRIEIPFEKKKNEKDAYNLIDETVDELYNNIKQWEEYDFIEAARMLIEDWGDKHDGQFKESFPRVYPEKEKILMNVVWKKEKRELMMSVSAHLTEDQLRVIIQNSEEISTLASKVKSLEDENAILKNQLDELRNLGFSQNEEDAIGDSDSEVVIAPIEIEAETSNGEFRTIRIIEQQYAGLPLEEIEAYVSQAKKDVVNYFREWNERDNCGFTFDPKRIAMNSYSQLYGIYDKEGHEIPLVVHSYLGPQFRFFNLNWYDWQLLQQPGSMLWVKTKKGLQCIPLYALPVRRYTFNFELGESKEDKAKLLTLAMLGKEYSNEVSFDFGNNMPSNFFNPVAFKHVPAELRTCVDSIREICDANESKLAQLYNLGSNIPLLKTESYSNALEEIETGTVREIYDLPANDMEQPTLGAGLNEIL